jgi:steroid delta-isomerase-like uncharacterized protein
MLTQRSATPPRGSAIVRLTVVLLLAAGAAHAADAVKILDGYMAAWNVHDAAKAASFFADDGTYYDASVGTPQVGRQAAQTNVIEVFLKAVPDCLWKRNGAPIVGRDGIAFEWTFSGTNTGDWSDGTKATGKPFTLKGTSFVRLKKGKIAYQGDYYDALGFFKQLGLM